MRLRRPALTRTAAPHLLIAGKARRVRARQAAAPLWQRRHVGLCIICKLQAALRCGVRVGGAHACHPVCSKCMHALAAMCMRVSGSCVLNECAWKRIFDKARQLMTHVIAHTGMQHLRRLVARQWLLMSVGSSEARLASAKDLASAAL